MSISSSIKTLISGGEVKYSPDEQIVGQWIDGKTLYQKTVDFGENKNIGTSWTAISSSEVPANMYQIISGFGSSAVTSDSIGSVRALSFSITASGTAFNLAAPAACTVRYITIQYTKTTD